MAQRKVKNGRMIDAPQEPTAPNKSLWLTLVRAFQADVRSDNLRNQTRNRGNIAPSTQSQLLKLTGLSLSATTAQLPKATWPVVNSIVNTQGRGGCEWGGKSGNPKLTGLLRLSRASVERSFTHSSTSSYL